MQGQMLTKPQIVICLSEHKESREKIREIQAGIEEEGVPYSLVPGDGKEATALAWQAANLSHFGAGIGVSTEGMCIHFHKLSPSEPLFCLGKNDNPKLWRLYGYNAARLVKGLPFKEQEASYDQPVYTEKDEQLYREVERIVMKILQESAKERGRFIHA